jgi:hypothetical protein
VLHQRRKVLMEFCLGMLFENGGEKMTIEEKNRDTGRSGVPPDIRFHRVYRRDRLNGFHLDFHNKLRTDRKVALLFFHDNNTT